MPPMSIEDYRQRCEECERLAETATSPYVRETMRYLAVRWRNLADEEEAKERHRPKPPRLGPQHPSD
jgi:hypothetical protein